jgi:hypothetical protein
MPTMRSTWSVECTHSLDSAKAEAMMRLPEWHKRAAAALTAEARAFSAEHGEPDDTITLSTSGPTSVEHA